MRKSHNRRLSHGRMRDKSTFKFGSADSVTGYIQYIIHASSDPNISVTIFAATIPSEIVSWIWVHVCCQISIVVPKTCPCHRWPWLFNGQNTSNVFPNITCLGKFYSRVGIKNNSVESEKWKGTASRLHGCDARQVGNRMPTSFGLPVSIDNGTSSFSNHIVVPVPCLRIDRFANSSQYLQRCLVVLIRKVIAVSHQTSNRCRRSIKNTDFMSLNHVPITTGVWIHWCTFKHKRREAVNKWSINDVGVSCNPSTVGNTSIYVRLGAIERALQGNLCNETISSGSVKEALGLTSASGRVQNKHGVFAVQPGARTIGASNAHFGIHIHISSWDQIFRGRYAFRSSIVTKYKYGLNGSCIWTT
mmetsp:Transcript_23123/g.33135  ORF Transcript_23123/g.33135 Transcript_23123/m.33135 type:complete len:360 (-) Transcript_23123:640-1719(-)